jgi:hypothetical protein
MSRLQADVISRCAPPVSVRVPKDAPSYPAEPLPHVPYGCTIYAATISGRQFKVYVQGGTHPPIVRTVVWTDDS